MLAPNLITNFIIICLIVFTLCVFILSRRENIEGLNNSENQIADIISVHTKRLKIEYLLESKQNQKVNIHSDLSYCG